MQAKRTKDNLLSGERKALRHVRQRTDIKIKPADKGSAIVMMSKDDYIKEAHQQLNAQLYYQKLTVDPTPQYMSEIKCYVLSMFDRGLINKNTRKSLVPYQP